MSIPAHQVEKVNFATRRGPVDEFIRRAPEVLPHLAEDIKAAWRELNHWDDVYLLEYYDAPAPGEDAYAAERKFTSKQYFAAVAQLRRYGQHAAYRIADTDPAQYAEVVALNNARNQPLPARD